MCPLLPTCLSLLPSHKQAFNIKTIEQLGKWKHYTAAQAIAVLAATEEAGRRPEGAASNINGIVVRPRHRRGGSEGSSVLRKEGRLGYNRLCCARGLGAASGVCLRGRVWRPAVAAAAFQLSGVKTTVQTTACLGVCDTAATS